MTAFCRGVLHLECLKVADLRRSEPHQPLHVAPPDILAHIYRISTDSNLGDGKCLIPLALPSYPEIIQNSRH
jgi:hypothetical protein